MEYKDMHELIRKNISSREFFLAQPFHIQIALNELNEYIHTAEQLYMNAELLQKGKKCGVDV